MRTSTLPQRGMMTAMPNTGGGVLLGISQGDRNIADDNHKAYVLVVLVLLFEGGDRVSDWGN